jgi:hypothetical protein
MYCMQAFAKVFIFMHTHLHTKCWDQEAWMEAASKA